MDTAATGLSVPQGAALTIGAVFGTGVLALPALAAATAGPASLVAWAALVVLSIPLAGTFAALGVRYPDSGGVSTYVRRAFGASAAAAVGWCFYAAIALGAVPAAMFAGGYVADTFGGGRATTVATSAALIVAVTVLNACGVRVSGRVQLALTTVLIALLLIATVAALPSARIANLTPFAPHGWTAIGPAAAVLVWGFSGWEAVTSLSGDYRRPRRDIPRVTAIAVGCVGALYLTVATTSLMVLGPGAGSSAAPLADLLAVGIGGPVRIVTTVIAVLLTLGAMNAYFAGGGKLGAALGRDGALPAWFARGNATGEVPRRSLAVVSGGALSVLVVTAAAGVDLHATVLLVTGSFTLVYVFGTAAAVRLLPRGTWAHAGAVISLVGVTGLLVLTGRSVLWGIAVGAASVAYTTLTSRRTMEASMAIPSGRRSERIAP